MFARSFHLSRFLRAVSGTEPFRDYCRSKDLAIPHTDRTVTEEWTAAVSCLPSDAQVRIEFELAQVNELSSRGAIDQLLGASRGSVFPADDVPFGPALALWFYVHQPDAFREVFFHHEVTEAHAWRSAIGKAGLAPATIAARATVLGEELRQFFHRDYGIGRFGAVEAHPIGASVCFVARIADRIQLVEGFTDRGQATLHRVRPALSVLFAYHPANGTVLLKCRLRALDRVRELFRCFGRAVLGSAVEHAGEAFQLDRLLLPFHPLADAPDMESVRLKALHLRYPERIVRRRVKLETLTGDEPTAMDQLLRAHVGTDARELTVCYAEIEVRLRVEGRPKHYLIRLWPDRCSLDQTALGERLTTCLRRWGLAHG
jgi:hypothetical protein